MKEQMLTYCCLLTVTRCSRALVRSAAGDHDIQNFSSLASCANAWIMRSVQCQIIVLSASPRGLAYAQIAVLSKT